jgi:Holliday junction DNA helicase RuvA
LTTVQGVGARLALAILSAVAPEQLGLAILSQDKAALTRADGVGARLAARIVNELREKVGSVTAAPMPVAASPAEASDGPAGDAVSALVNLGYRRSEAYGAVARAAQRLGARSSAEALLRAALQELAQGNSAGASQEVASD